MTLSLDGQKFIFPSLAEKKLFLKTLEELKEKNFSQRLWEKDPSLWKEDLNHQKVIKNSLGWLTVPEWIKERLPELKRFALQIKKEGFKQILLLGMGGSSLAPEMFRTSLSAKDGYPKLQVLDSTNPDWIESIEKTIQPKKTLFIFSSKSGTTIEPLSFFRYFYEKSGKRGEQFIAITDPGTFLEQLAKECHFHKIFLNPADIGGRFSALSYFGIVPAALAGMNVNKIVTNALRMMQACGPAVPLEKNPGILLGAFLASMTNSGRDKVTLSLSKKIKDFGLWIEQLIAESSGKEEKGIIPVTSEPILDQDHYGKDRAFVLITLKETSPKKIVRELRDSHPLLEIKLNQAEDLGGEFFRWEIATATACSLMGVNAFDQPDVQSAKDKTQALLKELPPLNLPLTKGERRRGLSSPQPSSLPSPLEGEGEVEGKMSEANGERLKNFLRGAQKGDYIGLLAFLPCKKNLEKELSKLRESLQKLTNLPVLWGYGPRYLHSTGQLFKGGPNTGLFLLLTCQTKRELPVPESPFTFGQLQRAQAIGDYQALQDKGRRALWLELKSPPEKSLKALSKSLAISNPSKR